MIEAITGILKRVFDLISKRIENKDAKNEIKKELELASNEIEKMHYADVQSARDQGKAEIGLSLRDPRSWVRPAWAFTALFMWVFNLYQSGWVFESYDYAIIFSVASFYFGSRFFEKKQRIKQVKSVSSILGNWIK